jgi:histidinol-phosphate aminotransferase
MCDSLFQSSLSRKKTSKSAIYRPELSRNEKKLILAKLDCNENPNGPSSIAIWHASQFLFSHSHRYPDSGCKNFKESLVVKFGFEKENYTIGNGSDSILDELLRLHLVDNKKLLISEYDFIGAFHLASSYNIPLKKVLMPCHVYDLEYFLSNVTESTGVIFFSNPNNPIGCTLLHGDFINFMNKIRPDILVIIDEAYIEYADQDRVLNASALLSEYPNLFIIRTLSKFYALAGLRIGYGIGHKAIVKELENRRLPFVVNSAGLIAAQYALQDKKHNEMTLKLNTRERNYLSSQLLKLGFKVYFSQTNFITIDVGKNARTLHTFLYKNGIIVKTLFEYKLSNCLRISIGSNVENRYLVKMLTLYVQKRIDNNFF